MGISKTVNSPQYYDLIADEYVQVREQRNTYLNRIDSIIIEDFHMKAKRILDVGAGDGSRCMKIFESINADEVCMVEESENMAKNIQRDERINIYLGSIQTFQSQKNFDLILCLWNVLGHVNTFDERIRILKRLKSYLSTDGVIVIDFNNRYNYKHYGIVNVVRNMLKSVFIKEPGWFDIKNDDINTKVYIHSYFEIKHMISLAGLRIKSLRIIDYDNGEEHKNLFKGQYLFYLQSK